MPQVPLRAERVLARSRLLGREDGVLDRTERAEQLLDYRKVQDWTSR